MYAWPTRDSAFFHRFLAQNANLLSQRETLIFLVCTTRGVIEL